VRRADALERRLPDGVMVLGAVPGDPIAVRGPAAAVWELLETPASVAALVATLAEIARVEPRTIVADVDVVIDRLAASGAIEPVP
jgi:hypothetical protein